jgi:hypothetical protein
VWHQCRQLQYAPRTVASRGAAAQSSFFVLQLLFLKTLKRPLPGFRPLVAAACGAWASSACPAQPGPAPPPPPPGTTAGRPAHGPRPASSPAVRSTSPPRLACGLQGQQGQSVLHLLCLQLVRRTAFDHQEHVECRSGRVWGGLIQPQAPARSIRNASVCVCGGGLTASPAAAQRLSGGPAQEETGEGRRRTGGAKGSQHRVQEGPGWTEGKIRS